MVFRFSFLQKALIFAFILVVSLFLLASCVQTPPEPSDGTTEESTAKETEAQTDPPYEITLSGEYKIVYPEGSEKLFVAANTLAMKLSTVCGVECEISSDLVLPIPGYEEREFEIVLGDTGRAVTEKAAKGLRAQDTVIAVIDHKLVILGGSEDLTVEAITYFIENLLSENGVLSSGELYRKTGTYRVDSLKVNGVDIFDYTIVYQSGPNSPYRAVAEELRALIAEISGYLLPVVSSDAEEQENEFLIGSCPNGGTTDSACGRTGFALGTDSLFAYATAAINQSGNKLALVSQDELGVARGLEEWFAQYFSKDATGELAVTLQYDTRVEAVTPGLELAEGATMRVMTNNIKSAEEIETRAPLLVEIYLEYFPDIIGLQEFPTDAYSLVLGPLSEYYAVADRTIGTSSDTSRTPILYRKDLYEVVDGETFYYDCRWPKTKTKTLAWAVFRNKETGKLFGVLNTHFAIISDDYDTEGYYGEKYYNNVQGVQWRNDNARQVLETLAMMRTKYGETLPVFFMGDLNCNTTSDALKNVATELSESASVAITSKTTGTGSSHTIGKAPSTSALPIDYVFVTSESIDVYTHTILTGGQNVLDSTDHCPVICDVTIN